MIQIRELSQAEAKEFFPASDDSRKIIAHPFGFKRTHFIAILDHQIVGGMSANVSQSDSRRGYFGFMSAGAFSGEKAQGVISLLLHSAQEWLKKNGVTQVIGPVNYSTLFDYRVRIDSDTSLPAAESFHWEPKRNSDYVSAFLDAGYRLYEEYYSRAYRDVSLVLPVSEKRYQEARNLGFQTRPIQFSGGESSPDLLTLFRINSCSFQESFLVEPFDLAAYRTLNVPKYANLLSDFSFFLLNPEGEEVGYFFLFQDQGYVVWKTLAVLPEYQKMGLAGFGIHHALLLAESKGISKVIAALIRNGAPSESLLTRAESLKIWEHRYGVFKKEI